MARSHPILRKWFFLFLFFVVAGLVAAGMAVGALLGYIDTLPNIQALEYYNPPEITRIYDRTGNTQLAEFFYNSERREVIHYDEVPQHVVHAFLSIEDERFYNHFGVDLEGIGRAVKEAIRGEKRVQGASTITMQVARNIVLLDSTRRMSRKIREVLTALQIERYYSKEQILEFYMNQIFFGARAWGVQAAAKTYFNKDVKDLTIPEAAMIAGLPKAPSQLSPIKNAEKARARRNVVLFNMRKLGYIKSDEEYQRFIAMPIELNPAPTPQSEAPYFVDFVGMRMLEEDSMQQTSELGQKGYTIVSSVDLNLQRICEEELSKGLREVEKKIEEQKEERFGVEARELGAVRRKQERLARIKEVKDASIIVSLQGYTAEVHLPDKLPYFNPQSIIKPGNLIDIKIDNVRDNRTLEAHLRDQTHVQGAAVLLDVPSGEILALAGGDDFDDPVNNGQWNRAVQNGRQPGSCWKPLLFASAFDVNDDSGAPRFTPGTVMDDSAVSYGNWSPKNYENSYHGDTSLFEALVKSRNVPTVKLFMDIGAKRAVQLYHRFNLVDKPVSNWVLHPVPPMSLGTPDITPLELAAAYAALANRGMGIRPSPVKRVYSTKSPTDSRIIRPDQRQVVSPQAAYMTTRILQHVVTMGTAKTTVGKWVEAQTDKGRKLPEIAAKTGTTNDCYVAWMVGYTPDLALAIYVGYDEHRTMGPKMVGGGTVGPIWVPMMDRILQTRSEWKMKFDVPSGVVFRDICSKSGKLATSACNDSGDNVFNEAAFKEGTAPNKSCDYHGGASPAPVAGAGQQPGDAESQYVPDTRTSVGEYGGPVAPGPYQ